MKFIDKYIVQLLIAVTIVGFISIALLSVVLSRYDETIDSRVENRVYTECISHLRLDSDSATREAWVNRCSDIAKAIATVPCSK